MSISDVTVGVVECADEVWDHRMAEAGGNVFQSSAWGRLSRATGGDPIRLEFRRANDVVGLAMGAARRTRYRILGRFRDHLVLETTPVMWGGVSVADALESLAVFAREQRFAAMTLGTTDGSLGSLEALPKGYEITPRLEFRVDLSGGYEPTLARMTSAHRRNMRKARAEALGFCEDTSLDGALALRGLQDRTFERRDSLGHTRGRAWDREGYRTTVRAYLDGGVLRFWFGVEAGKKLSGVGILTFGTRAYYLIGGTSPAGYKNRAAFFVFDRVLERLSSEGITSLSLGGVPAEALNVDDQDHGLYRFKAGFGSQVIELATLRRRLRGRG